LVVISVCLLVVHVAVPDFAAGAMENWGLIIYRETALLYDAATASAANKQRVAVVVTHELAHMVSKLPCLFL
jgi:aminopeptidase N